MIPGPQSIETYELIHGGKPERESELDKLWQGFRQRIDQLSQPAENKETAKETPSLD